MIDDDFFASGGNQAHSKVFVLVEVDIAKAGGIKSDFVDYSARHTKHFIWWFEVMGNSGNLPIDC